MFDGDVVSKILGFDKFVDLDMRDQTVTKTYMNIPEKHIERIRSAAKFLSENGFGPAVYKITERPGSLQIEMEMVNPLSPYEVPEGINPEDLREQINILVERLHEADWAHGDLHLENIGLNSEGLPVILDYDTMYHISQGADEEWLQRWMAEGFGWEGTYEDFVNYDYENWQTDWLGEEGEEIEIIVDL